MSADVLSPGMAAILRQIAAGQVIDGRSWRSLEGVKSRGLIERAPGNQWALNAAGRAALAQLDGEPAELQEPPVVLGTAEDGWVADYYERHPERAPKRKAPAPA